MLKDLDACRGEDCCKESDPVEAKPRPRNTAASGRKTVEELRS